MDKLNGSYDHCGKIFRELKMIFWRPFNLFYFYSTLTLQPYVPYVLYADGIEINGQHKS